MIINCGTPTNKVLEFLDNHSQPAMRKDFSHINYLGDFINKIRGMSSLRVNAILVKAMMLD